MELAISDNSPTEKAIHVGGQTAGQIGDQGGPQDGQKQLHAVAPRRLLGLRTNE